MTDIDFVDYYVTPGTTINYIAMISDTTISTYEMSGTIADSLSATIVSTNGGTRNAIRLSGTIPSGTSDGNWSIQFNVTGTDGVTDRGAAYIQIGTSNKDVSIGYQPHGNPNINVGETYDAHFWATKGLSSYTWSILNYSTADQAIADVSMVEDGDEMDLTIEGVSAGSMSISIRCTADGINSSQVFNQTIYVSESGNVSSISISGSSEVDSGEEIVLTAVTSPSTAINRHVTWTKVTGSSYFEIETADTSTGGTCTIIADQDQTTSRSCSVRATAADGGGATASKSFTINPVTTVTMPSSLVVGVGETVNVTATFSTTLSYDYAISPSSVATVRLLSAFNGGATFAITGVSAGTATFEIQYQNNGTKTKTCTVNVRGTTPVDPDTPELVSSIDIQAPSGTTVQAGSTISLSAFAYPTSAENRRLDFSIVSGSEYATLTSTSTSSVGGTCVLRGDVPGTVVVRATARDDGGYYDEITITVIEATTLCTSVIIYNRGVRASDSIISEAETTVGKHVDVYPGGDPHSATDTTVTHQIRSGSSCITIELIDDDVYGSIGLSQYRIVGIAEGTAVIRFTANDGSGCYDDLTVTVGAKINDDYPYNYSKRITLDVYENAARHGGNSLTNLLPNGGPYRIHGGYDSISLQDGLYVLAAGVHVTALSPETSAYTSTNASLQGEASEPGIVCIYVEDNAGYTQMTEVVVEGLGEFTKTLVFNANLPSGTTLKGTLPSAQTKEHTAGIANFTIPSSDISVDGYVFMGWRDAPGNGGSNVLYNAGATCTVTGDDVTLTLYAEWFPIPEGATGDGSSSNPFTWVDKTYTEVSHTVPNKGDYTIRYQDYYDSEVPDGLAFRADGTTYTAIPYAGIQLESGSLVLEGTPTQAGEIGFNQYGERRYYVHFRQIVAAGEVPEPDEDLTVTFDANGGVFPSGQEVVTLTAPDRVYTLPDWTVVDRPGYRLSYWRDADGNRAEMGQQKNTIETWTAVWASDSRGYDTSVLPWASIRIYRTLDEYIDATYLQAHGGLASIQIAENSEGSAAFTLLNDYRAAGHSLLADDCDLWSSGGAGPIETGMYVRIESVESNGRTSYLFDGFITTISPQGETVSFEAGDRIAFLGKSGTTYRRNFYGSGRTSSLFPAGHDSNGLYADISSMPVDGVPDGTAYWKIIQEAVTTGSAYAAILGLTWDRVVLTFDVPLPMVEGITLAMGFADQSTAGDYAVDVRITMESGSSSRSWSISYTGAQVSMQWQDYALSFDGDPMTCASGTATLTFELTSSRGSPLVYLRRSSGAGSMNLVAYNADGSVHQTFSACSVQMTVTTFEWREITGREPASSGRIYVTQIEGEGNLDDSSLWTPSEGRVRIAYSYGTQSVVSIASSMSWGLGMTPLAAVDVADADLQMFRTGGGYALDYFRKLADVADADGRQRAFMVRGYTTPVAVLTSRHRISDSPSLHVHYGGDAVTGQAVAFSAFSPSMTFKNRPNLAVVRASMSSKSETESRPIIVAVEDSGSTTRRYGLAVETVLADSTVNLALDAASAAWGKVTESDLDEWEGTVTIPGIRRDILPASGAYGGSGVALQLTDTRVGIVGARARARQLRLDFNACTTQITLTNRSMMYSSGIADTAAMAVTSADVATGNTSATLFNTQYVRIKTERAQTIKDSGNVVEGHLYTTGAWFSFGDVSILQLPIGRYVLVANALADGSIHSEDEASYDVYEVRINGGSAIPIRASIRPDYYRGQTLVLNLDFPQS